MPSGLELDVPGSIVDEALTHAALDAVDAVVTRASVGIAETGSVVLNHGPGQRDEASRHVATPIHDLWLFIPIQ